MFTIIVAQFPSWAFPGIFRSINEAKLRLQLIYVKEGECINFKTSRKAERIHDQVVEQVYEKKNLNMKFLSCVCVCGGGGPREEGEPLRFIGSATGTSQGMKPMIGWLMTIVALCYNVACWDSFKLLWER